MKSSTMKKSSIFDKLPKWNTPLPGKQLNLKEWILFILGSIGAYGATTITPYVSLQQGMYIAAACNINVDHIALIGIINSLVTILTTPLVSWILDNTNTKLGKFRPYLIFMPIPIVICFFAIGQVIKIDNYNTMIITYTIIFVIFNQFVRIYTAAYNGIPQVISPSMEERTQIMSIGLMLSSAGPTLVNIMFPFFANLFYATDIGGDGINQIGAFSWLLPIMSLCFMAVGICLGLGVKERTVVPKDFKQRQSFIQGCKKTVENKYFWILNISNLLGVLKFFMSTIVVWYITYDIAPDLQLKFGKTIADMAQPVITTLIGGACVPGMLLCPMVIKKVGMRKLLLAINFSVAIFLIPMLFINNPWVHIICIFMVNVANGFQIVALPACQAEINDYQQFKTGDRIEGFLGQFGSIFLTAISMATAFIAPAVNKSFGYVEDTSVLYNPDTLYGITATMSAISLVSAILCAIPFFFWDLTEKKHKGIMQILKVRAMHIDGDINDDTATSLEREISGGNLEILPSFLESIENKEAQVDNKSEDTTFTDTENGSSVL